MPKVTMEQLIEKTLEYGDNFSIIDWGSRYAHNENFIDDGVMVLVSEMGECGTTACLAGNACLIVGDRLVRKDGDVFALTKDGSLVDVEVRATDLLGDGRYLFDMFRRFRWPDEYYDAYMDADNNMEAAKVACEVVRYYMGGK